MNPNIRTLPGWKPYLGQGPAAPSPMPTAPAGAPGTVTPGTNPSAVVPSAGLSWMDHFTYRSISLGAGAVGGIVLSGLFKLIFPSLRSTRQYGLYKAGFGAVVGLAAAAIPVSGRILDVTSLLGGYYIGSGAVDQLLPGKSRAMAAA